MCIILEYYAHVNNYGVTIDVPKSYVEKERDKINVFELSDAREVTLAQYDPITTDIITAHNIKDYRHKVYSLILLPQVRIIFDAVLEGLGYIDEHIPAQGQDN